MNRPNAITLLAGGILVAAVATAIVGNIFTPHLVTDQALMSRLKPPAFLEGGSAEFPLGTDRIGRDMARRSSCWKPRCPSWGWGSSRRTPAWGRSWATGAITCPPPGGSRSGRRC